MYYYYKQQTFNTRYTADGVPVDYTVRYLEGPFINIDDLYDDLPEWMQTEDCLVEVLYVPEAM